MSDGSEGDDGFHKRMKQTTHEEDEDEKVHKRIYLLCILITS